MTFGVTFCTLYLCIFIHTPIELFTQEYTKLIRFLKDHNIMPIITTLPPLDSQRFFQWWCNNLNKENILKWLGSIDQIYKHQEFYSNQVQKIAISEKSERRGPSLTILVYPPGRVANRGAISLISL